MKIHQQRVVYQNIIQTEQAEYISTENAGPEWEIIVRQRQETQEQEAGITQHRQQVQEYAVQRIRQMQVQEQEIIAVVHIL